jgi:hypothetical protein
MSISEFVRYPQSVLCCHARTCLGYSELVVYMGFVDALLVRCAEIGYRV